VRLERPVVERTRRRSPKP